MAYVSQDRKKKLVAECKKVLAKYGVKATFRVRHRSTLVCTLREGGIDFAGLHKDRTNTYGDSIKADMYGGSINPYWYKDHYNGPALDFLKELLDAMNGRGTDDENFDKSNIQVDYFHVGWYNEVTFGNYNKPYVLNPELSKEVA